MLSRLHCPYLVELLGYSADQQHRLLIFEFIPNGTLHQHLHSTIAQSKPLNWWTRLRIALDCARALEFLHEHAVPPVIYGDFNCHNVLLDPNLRAKINAQISTPAMGTTGYLAPEWVCICVNVMLYMILSYLFFSTHWIHVIIEKKHREYMHMNAHKRVFIKQPVTTEFVHHRNICCLIKVGSFQWWT